MFPRNYPPIIYGLRRRLRESIKLANEEFFYEDLVLPIEDELVDFIFDARGDEVREAEFDYNWPYPVDPEEFDEDDSKIFTITLFVSPEDDMSAPINVRGDSISPGEEGFSEIKVWIEYEPGIDLSDHYKYIVGQLRGTLAHEIHHLTQEGPTKRPDCPVLPEKEGHSHKEYFVSACEVPAFVIGFRAESSYTGVPILELINEYLDNYIKIGKISKQEAAEIYEIWTNHSFI